MNPFDQTETFEYYLNAGFEYDEATDLLWDMPGRRRDLWDRLDIWDRLR